MKLIILLLVGVCVTNVYSLKLHKKQKLHPELKAVRTDSEISVKEKIHNFAVSTLQHSLETINEIQLRANATLNGVTSDVERSTTNTFINLNKHFEKYRTAFDLYETQLDAPHCLFTSYSELQRLFDESQSDLLACQEDISKKISRIRKEVNSNAIGIKQGIKLVVQSINDCTVPWSSEESPKCATRKSSEIRKTIANIHKIADAAQLNVMDRLRVIIDQGTNCSKVIIERAREEELKALDRVKVCVNGVFEL